MQTQSTLKQSGKFCKTLDVSEKVFDGDTNYKNSVLLDVVCPNSYLEVMFDKPYSVQYVVVHQGES